MKVTFDENPKEVEINPKLENPVEKNSKLKNMIVDYVGNKLNPENNDVTLQMVLEVFAKEFPDFVMPIAEENWIRGYRQALADVEKGERLAKEEQEREQT